MTSSRVGRFHPGVRLRSSLAAVAVVGLTMLVAAPVMVFSLHQSLVRDTELSAGLRASQLKGELVTNGPLAVQALLRTARGERSVAQVVDAQGRVVASSVDLDGLPEMTDVAPPPSGRRTTVEAAPDRRDGDHYLIVARGAKVHRRALRGPGGRVAGRRRPVDPQPCGDPGRVPATAAARGRCRDLPRRRSIVATGRGHPGQGGGGELASAQSTGSPSPRCMTRSAGSR